MPLFYPLISRSFRRIPKVVRLRCTESDDSLFCGGLLRQMPAKEVKFGFSPFFHIF